MHPSLGELAKANVLLQQLPDPDEDVHKGLLMSEYLSKQQRR